MKSGQVRVRVNQDNGEVLKALAEQTGLGQVDVATMLLHAALSAVVEARGTASFPVRFHVEEGGALREECPPYKTKNPPQKMKILPWALFGIAAVAAVLLVVQLQKESAEITHLLADNAALAGHVDSLRGELNYTKTLAAEKTLPLTVRTRAALTGSGKVVQIQNHGEQALRLQITLLNTAGETKDYQEVFDPNQMKEIGHLQRLGVYCRRPDHHRIPRL